MGEILIYLGKIIMPIILCYNVYSLYFTFRILSGWNTQNNSCKNVEQWRNRSFPHYLVVNHCNANDFELGEPLIVHLWLESVRYYLLFILKKFQVEIPKICMWKWLLMSNQWPFPLYFDICHGNAYYFEWRNVSLINVLMNVLSLMCI